MVKPSMPTTKFPRRSTAGISAMMKKIANAIIKTVRLPASACFSAFFRETRLR